MNCVLIINLVSTYLVLLLMYINLSDGFKWKSRPSNKALGLVGSTVYITWHYECNDKEFGYSTIFYNTEQKAFRTGYEQEYSIIANADVDFSVTGRSNVTIIIHHVDKNNSGLYCCVILCATKIEKECTKLVIYVLPHITYLSSSVSKKQGERITLVCNASGNPAPHVRWIHKDTNTVIANSYEKSFNITGKASGGKYCCLVSNDYGNAKNCTSLDVAEYQPINTKFTSNVNYTTANKTLKVSCTADAFPYAKYLIQQGNFTVVNNSSDGNVTITTPSNNGKTINISCIAKNDYGEGKPKYLQILIYVLPLITYLNPNYSRKQGERITLECNASGNPAPHVKWIHKDTNTVIAHSYVTSFNITGKTSGGKYCCQVSNDYGNATNCTSLNVTAVDQGKANKDDKESLPPSGIGLEIIVVVVVSALVIVALILVFVLILRKRNKSKSAINKGTQQQDNKLNQVDDENPYGEPIDAIRTPSQINASTSNADYATVEETGYKRATTTNPLPKAQNDEASTSKNVGSEREPVYAKVKKKNKKEKPADIPLNLQFPEIPTHLSNDLQQSSLTNTHYPNMENSNEGEEDEVDSGEGSWFPWA